jgi:hypothetical protein
MHSSRWRKRGFAATAFGFIALAALAGGAGTGGAAATTLKVTLTGQISSISSGGTAGYEATVENVGPSTVTQVTLLVDTVVGTYRASAVTAGSANCRQGPTASSMLCTTSQLASLEKFTVSVAFRAPAVEADSSLTATAKATVSAQTNGTPGNNGTSNWFGDPVSTSLTAASDVFFNTFALPDDDVSTGKSLRTELGFPSAFLNGYLGLVTGAGEYTDAASKLCDKCPTVFSKVSIPASLTTANPFSASSPYSFVLTLDPSAQPPGYKVAGISHLADAVGATWESVPLCTSATEVVPGPICLDELPSKNKKTGVITARGRGIENGSYGFD